MVLVDTSVWIDHLRAADDQLVSLLEHGQVVVHPMIIGELACGNLHSRSLLLASLDNLSFATEASHKEALYCLEQNRLMGKGIGYVDLHLLASVLLSSGVSLWTCDKRLRKIAEDLGLAWCEAH